MSPAFPDDIAAMTPAAKLCLHQLPDGARAFVAGVVSSSTDIDAVTLRRLVELGFLPGEPVQLLRRGPGGREPLAVLIGETLFALRLLEAQCIEVTPAPLS
jgi:ferrous iron transport protein A